MRGAALPFRWPAKWRAVKNTPAMLVISDSAMFSGVWPGSVSPPRAFSVPALQTTRSRPPTWAAAARTESSSRTSMPMTVIWPPLSAASAFSSSALSGVRQAAVTWCPAAAAWRVISSPMPRLAPVIRMRSAMGPVLFLRCGAYAAVSGLMTAGSNGVRENTSRSIGSKWLSGLVG